MSKQPLDVRRAFENLRHGDVGIQTAHVRSASLNAPLCCICHAPCLLLADGRVMHMVFVDAAAVGFDAMGFSLSLVLACLDGSIRWELKLGVVGWAPLFVSTKWVQDHLTTK